MKLKNKPVHFFTRARSSSRARAFVANKRLTQDQVLFSWLYVSIAVFVSPLVAWSVLDIKHMEGEEIMVNKNHIIII